MFIKCMLGQDAMELKNIAKDDYLYFGPFKRDSPRNMKIMQRIVDIIKGNGYEYTSISRRYSKDVWLETSIDDQTFYEIDSLIKYYFMRAN